MAQAVGALFILQDHSKHTYSGIIDLVVQNIEAGYRSAASSFLGRKENHHKIEKLIFSAVAVYWYSPERVSIYGAATFADAENRSAACRFCT
jgi:hypothetical protein